MHFSPPQPVYVLQLCPIRLERTAQKWLAVVFVTGSIAPSDRERDNFGNTEINTAPHEATTHTVETRTVVPLFPLINLIIFVFIGRSLGKNNASESKRGGLRFVAF